MQNEPAVAASIIDSMMDMFRIIDAEHHVCMMNQRMRAIGDIAPGGRCFDVLGRDDMCVHCISEKAIRTGQVESKTVHLRGRIYEVVASPLFMCGKACAVEVWRDITSDTRLRERLVNQNEKLLQDLSLARSLQHALLPERLPSLGDVAFFAHYEPCEDVGGDFYDVIPLRGGQVAFYIADVAGHGVTAAMLTVFFSQALRSLLAERGGALDEVLGELNVRFGELGLEDHLYITAWLGILDLSTGEVRYCNAGHAASPLLANGDACEALEVMGAPISRWPGKPPYTVHATRLLPGGRLLLYTDGLTDAWRRRRTGNILPRYAVPADVAREKLQSRPAERCLQDIWTTVSAGAGGLVPMDDVAMLLLHRRNADAQGGG